MLPEKKKKKKDACCILASLAYLASCDIKIYYNISGSTEKKLIFIILQVYSFQHFYVLFSTVLDFLVAKVILLVKVKHYRDVYMNINVPYLPPKLSPKYLYFK